MFQPRLDKVCEVFFVTTGKVVSVCSGRFCLIGWGFFCLFCVVLRNKKACHGLYFWEGEYQHQKAKWDNPDFPTWQRAVNDQE